MILLLEVGNTRLKWAWLDGKEFRDTGGKAYAVAGVDSVLGSALGAVSRPDRVLMASVAGEGTDGEIAGWISSRWKLDIDRVRSRRHAHGVRNAYRRPQRMGVDRWLALLAAHNRVSEGACIVDCGTAVTIDVLAGDGRHLGGLILPGFDMMRRALLAYTHIPRIEPVDEAPLLADDTASAVAGGCLHAVAALVDRIMAHSEKELQRDLRLLLTGSAAPRLGGVLGRDYEIHPDLVMEGLALVATGIKS